MRTNWWLCVYNSDRYFPYRQIAFNVTYINGVQSSGVKHTQPHRQTIVENYEFREKPINQLPQKAIMSPGARRRER